MKRLLFMLLAAGPLAGCQFSNPFARSTASDVRQDQPSNSPSRMLGPFADNTPSLADLERDANREFEQKNYTTAIPLFEQMLQQDPDNVSAHHRLAIIHDLNAEYAKAEPHYRAALEASPTNANIIGDLGYSYLLQGRLTEAERYLKHSHSLDPTLPNVVNNLGILYARQGNWAESERMLSQVLPPNEVRAAMLQWGMPPNQSPSATQGSTSGGLAQQPSTPQSTATEPSPETLALMQQLEEARRLSELQRAQEQQRRQLQDEYQRQQAAAQGFPYDPEGERLRTQMDLIDRSTLPDNDRTLLVGSQGTPSTTPPGQQTWPAPTGTPSPMGQPPSYQGMPNGGSTPQGSAIPETTVSQTQITPGGTSPGYGAQPNASSSGQFQPAPIHRNLHGTQGTSPQMSQQSWQGGGTVQQVGNTGASGSVQPAFHPNSPGNPEQAYYETGAPPSGMTPHTVTQTNGLSTQPPASGTSPPGAIGDINAFDAAARSAAIMGLGVGGGPMFPIATPLATQVSPGAGSMINGAMYPEPQRQLPTDRLMDFEQSFRYQPDGSMQSQAQEMRPGLNSMGQTMPSTMSQTQQAGASGMPSSPWQSNAGTGATALPPNPLAVYDQARADHDAQTQQMLQQTQGQSPMHYMVAPTSELNPNVPVVTGSQLMMNSPPGPSSTQATPPTIGQPTSFGTSGQPGRSQQFSTAQPSSSSQGQPQPSPYYPTENQLAPSPWDSIPRIDPAQQQQPASQPGVVTPPPYQPQGTYQTQNGFQQQSTTNVTQPTTTGYPPADQIPVIRPRP